MCLPPGTRSQKLWAPGPADGLVAAAGQLLRGGSPCVCEAPSRDSERVVFAGEQRGESLTVQGCWVSGQGPGCSLIG